ncbi:MAG TPA: GNAT family N-acetyltransferase [Verrucomicrobiae bacterium]|jgi:GNAT superfamily N-acetyltransferase
MKITHATTDEEIAACFPVMQQLRTHFDLAAFLTTVQRMKAEGYHLVFIADPDVRAVAGYRKMEMLATGPVLYVDDLVTAAEHRSRGYGKALLAWLLEEAKKQECQYLELDSGLKRLDAHRFYELNGLEKAAFHFSIPARAKAAWTAKLKL